MRFSALVAELAPTWGLMLVGGLGYVWAWDMKRRTLKRLGRRD